MANFNIILLIIYYKYNNKDKIKKLDIYYYIISYIKLDKK